MFSFLMFDSAFIRHRGLDPRSPKERVMSSRLGDGVPLSRNDDLSAMTM
jgi:hypothetical protein